MLLIDSLLFLLLLDQNQCLACHLANVLHSRNDIIICLNPYRTIVQCPFDKICFEAKRDCWINKIFFCIKGVKVDNGYIFILQILQQAVRCHGNSSTNADYVIDKTKNTFYISDHFVQWLLSVEVTRVLEAKIC